VSKLQSALFFEFGFVEYSEQDRELQSQTIRTKSFVEIKVKNPQYQSEKLVHRQELKNDEMNFADQDIVYVRIQSLHKKVKILISNENFTQSKSKEFIGSVIEFPFEFDNNFILKK
jgi:hypothetical protein